MALVRPHTTKSGLGRVHNYVGEQALCCKMVVSSDVHQPNHSYADHFMFHLGSDLTLPLWLQVCCTELSFQGITLQIIHRLVATQFHVLVHTGVT